MTDRLLTAEQAAQILGIKLVTMRSWIAKRMIGFTRLGKRAIRVPESEIEKLIDRGRIPSRESR